MPLESNPLVPDYAWSPTSGRYRSLITGRFVPFDEVRDALEVVMDASAVRINSVTVQLVNGQISLSDWQLVMMEQVKIEHTAAAAAARGGWAQMSQSDWGAVGRMIRDQYGYLNNFAKQIASGEHVLNGVTIVRADLYAGAARGTFEEMRRRYERTNNGMELEARVLGEADHCHGCISQATLGWQPIGTLEPIGSQECITRCHCRFKYRPRNPHGVWIVTDGE